MYKTLVIAHSIAQANDYIDGIDSGDTKYIPITPHCIPAGVDWQSAVFVDFILDENTIEWFNEVVLARYYPKPEPDRFLERSKQSIRDYLQEEYFADIYLANSNTEFTIGEEITRRRFFRWLDIYKRDTVMSGIDSDGDLILPLSLMDAFL